MILRITDFYVVGTSFEIVCGVTKKVCLPRFSLALGAESCCDVDYLSNTLAENALKFLQKALKLVFR